MNNFRFYTPTEVVFGKGVEAQTGELAAKYGSRALLVYGKGSVVRSGLLKSVEDSLAQAGVEYDEFGGAQPNPTLSHAEEGVRAALGFGADIIIAVGGGSAIDTAKGIAHGAANPENALWDIWTAPDAFAYNRRFTSEMLTGACRTCPHGEICAGGCRSYNHFTTGRLYENCLCAR